ncbi:MAG: AAA family ATPase [Myxococcota bacterium]
MELKLPLVVVHHSARHVEAWLPHFPDIRKVGPSLAEMRDDLALAVMEDFEAAGAEHLGAYQLPPQVSLKHVKVDTVARDRHRRRKYELKGTLGILLEKWPRDEVWIATPTRLPQARFAIRRPEELEAATARALSTWCLKNRVERLVDYHAARRERLDILEVDAYLPSILPTAPRPRLRAPRRKPDETKPPETAEEKEERRKRRRLSATTLREVARNLTHAAMDERLERAFGREALVRTLVDELHAREGVALCLVGPSGVGKTALIHELTRRLHHIHHAANSRRDVWRVDGNRFIAGMMYVGQWEERARKLMEELVDTGDILYVDDLTSLVYAGRTAKRSTNVAQFLEPHLARGELTVIAECTPERFQKLREEAPTFASLFRVIPVPPLTDRETLPVLLGTLRDLESEESTTTGVRLSPAALESVLHLTRRFLAHDAFPGKAVRLLKAVLAQNTGVKRLETDHVFATLQRQTGLPSFVTGQERARTRAQIQANLGAMVVGQPEAVEAVTDVVVAMQHALSDPDKPLGTFLFVGPTGVGKTETAKALAAYLFGSASRLLRFDMSEFNTPYSVTRLVGHSGAPEGELTLALRTQPFRVILFDEVEKAHPRVFDALLQLLGEGRITDATGRTADARQSVIIMTSNLGVREAASRTGFNAHDEEESRRHYITAARKFFRPEFFNRIDRVVPFRSLGPDALRVVVEHALTDLLGRRGIQRGNVLVEVEPELLDLLVEKAFDPRYGARPLKRALERKLTVPLAHHLVRRRTEDFSRVELFRRGEDMGLTVTALRPADALPGVVDSERWSTVETAQRFRATQDLVQRLLDSEAVQRLKDARSRMLQAGGDDPTHVGALELLDELSSVAEQVQELAEGELAETTYLEETYVRDLTGALRRDDRNPKPTQVFTETPLQVNREGALKVARARIATLWERATILAHQVHAAARAQHEVVTVLVEPASSDVASALIDDVIHALPERNLRAFLAEAEGEWRDRHAHGARPIKRALRVYSGPGIRALLQPLTGYALLAAPGMPPRRILVRVELLEGGDGVAAVRARDEKMATFRRTRRAGQEPVADNVPGTLTWERRPEEPMRHVASGIAVHPDPRLSRRDRILAAILHARGGEG